MVREKLFDRDVIGDITREDESAVEFFGEFGNAIPEPIVLIGERQLRAFAVTGPGNAVGNRVFRQYASDQDTLVCKKSHDFSMVKIGWNCSCFGRSEAAHYKGMAV